MNGFGLEREGRPKYDFNKVKRLPIFSRSVWSIDVMMLISKKNSIWIILHRSSQFSSSCMVMQRNRYAFVLRQKSQQELHLFSKKTWLTLNRLSSFLWVLGRDIALLLVAVLLPASALGLCLRSSGGRSIIASAALLSDTAPSVKSSRSLTLPRIIKLYKKDELRVARWICVESVYFTQYFLVVRALLRGGI